MNTQTITAQSCSLFEIDAELEEAFDQLQEERDMTGMISDESRERCTQLFAELGKKIDRIKTAAERVLQLAHENRLYAGLTSMRWAFPATLYCAWFGPVNSNASAGHSNSSPQSPATERIFNKLRAQFSLSRR